MFQQNQSVRFTVRARTRGAATPQPIATELDRLNEALHSGAEELALEAQDGNASPRLIGTWRESPHDSSRVPGVVYDYSPQLAGRARGSSLGLPRVEVYSSRDQWLAAVRAAAHKYAEASLPVKTIR